MTDDDVIAAMERYGGSFIHALAQCYRAADDVNRRVLRAAFTAYWAQYAELAERQRAEDKS
jgi:pyruvate/2-oxoacid:ferredoxin oxidoreductase beta subunit